MLVDCAPAFVTLQMIDAAVHENSIRMWAQVGVDHRRQTFTAEPKSCEKFTRQPSAVLRLDVIGEKVQVRKAPIAQLALVRQRVVLRQRGLGRGSQLASIEQARALRCRCRRSGARLLPLWPHDKQERPKRPLSTSLLQCCVDQQPHSHFERLTRSFTQPNTQPSTHACLTRKKTRQC